MNLTENPNRDAAIFVGILTTVYAVAEARLLEVAGYLLLVAIGIGFGLHIGKRFQQSRPNNSTEEDA